MTVAMNPYPQASVESAAFEHGKDCASAWNFTHQNDSESRSVAEEVCERASRKAFATVAFNGEREGYRDRFDRVFKTTFFQFVEPSTILE